MPHQFLQTSLSQTPAKSYPHWDVNSRASVGRCCQLPQASPVSESRKGPVPGSVKKLKFAGDSKKTRIGLEQMREVL